MALKKSELYSSIWKSCDELRGGMDASQYKDYILVLLFVKYVSDKYAGQPNAIMTVPPGGGFADMIDAKGKPDIGDRINKIIGRLADANDLRGVITLADFDDDAKLGKGQEMVDRLTKIIGIFQDPGLDFSRNRAEGDDLLGDAYEYLMRHFATESGKSKGQFYTPAEVSRVLAKVVGINPSTKRDQTVYDPTCGSGSLLLKAADEAPHGITIYGQEKDNATAGLARMNMFLHDKPEAEIWQDNTLSKPKWKDKRDEKILRTFDFIVMNPPFSDKAWMNGVNTANETYNRFAYGVPPAKNGDYAYLLHVLTSMKSTGKAAVIMPHGVLFRGNTEAEIRRNLIEKGVIKGIIGLPPNLFYGTGIPACIIVMDKEHMADRKGIFMIDASKGFMKDGNKNRLRHQDIHKIVDTFNKQIEVEKYSRMVPYSEIKDKKNDYNLNIPRFIDSTEPEDLQDIEGHLKGGIPERDIAALEPYWKVCPTLKGNLIGPGDRKGYCQLKTEAAQIKPTIFSHKEFRVFNDRVHTLFTAWQANHIARLRAIRPGDHPKALIEDLSEDLLSVFSSVPLIDRYDVYQHLMTYWASTMQDDIYMIVGDGWKEANKLRLIEDKKSKEQPDLVIDKKKLKAELIPPALIIARYFKQEKADLDKAETDLATATQSLEEMQEEYGGDEGLLSDLMNEKGKIPKGAVADRLKEIKKDKEADEERKVLTAYLELVENESAAGSTVKDLQKALDHKVAARYARLTEDEIKTLVVEDKWLATLATEIQTELDRVSQALAGRLRQLAERYATPLPKLEEEAEALSAKVEGHLRKMGFAW